MAVGCGAFEIQACRFCGHAYYQPCPAPPPGPPFSPHPPSPPPSLPSLPSHPPSPPSPPPRPRPPPFPPYAPALPSKDECRQRDGLRAPLPKEVAANTDRSLSHSFYVYRAQNEEDYHIENNNLANVAGVLKFTHSEVVTFQERLPGERGERGECTRHFGVTRISRFLLRMKNPDIVTFGELRPQFAPFVAFDKGQCTSCVGQDSDLWSRYGGYVVGCQTQMNEDFVYPSATWYSLPGRCPSSQYGFKTDECTRRQPGGECPRGVTPDGSPTCTWSLEHKGDVRLDELTDLDSYPNFCEMGFAEFPQLDGKPRRQGHVCFWDTPKDMDLNAERVARVMQLFQRKYPDEPADLLGPACEW